jgi:hypothetical protein
MSPSSGAGSRQQESQKTELFNKNNIFEPANFLVLFEFCDICINIRFLLCTLQMKANVFSNMYINNALKNHKRLKSV